METRTNNPGLARLQQYVEATMKLYRLQHPEARLDRVGMVARAPDDEVAGHCAITAKHAATWESDGSSVGATRVIDGTDATITGGGMTTDTATATVEDMEGMAEGGREGDEGGGRGWSDEDEDGRVDCEGTVEGPAIVEEFLALATDVPGTTSIDEEFGQLMEMLGRTKTLSRKQVETCKSRYWLWVRRRRLEVSMREVRGSLRTVLSAGPAAAAAAQEEEEEHGSWKAELAAADEELAARMSQLQVDIALNLDTSLELMDVLKDETCEDSDN
ncbi:hypothetical protein GSI_09845 [Ganoderma sinense ZZ0214-1]|uniref:Uncharacterized protein n=1 Tax=Ganoderma sinense ZZ0214-1 TaxID=1077348 RepID=A0A2G8S2M2_9APHY|nr:hypothetical protein GSI_09845 [Ganoderma sinense ZZ0214-1]